MAGASEVYVDGVYERFNYLGAWLPNSNLKIGDVGIREGAAFKQMTTLQALGIPFSVREGKAAGDFRGNSQAGVSVQIGATADVAPVGVALAKAGVTMKFDKRGAFIFHAVDCIQDEIEDKDAVGRAVLELVKAGTWSPDWEVVDTLVTAGSATIVVASSQDAALELSADTPIGELDLANVNAGFAVRSQRGDLVHFVANQGLSPLFRLSRVHRSWIKKLFGSAGAITFGGPSAAAPADDPGTAGGLVGDGAPGDIWENVVPTPSTD